MKKDRGTDSTVNRTGGKDMIDKPFHMCYNVYCKEGAVFRECTKSWFRITRLHLKSVCSHIHQGIYFFFFGCKMAILDVYQGVRGIVQLRYPSIPWRIVDLGRSLFLGLLDHNLGEFKNGLRWLWGDIKYGYRLGRGQ